MKIWTKVLVALALAGVPLLVHQLLYWYDNRHALALRKEIYRELKH